VENARKRLDEAAAGARVGGVRVSTEVRTGDAAEQILAAAKDVGASEVIVGYKSYESLAQATVGTIAEKVVRYAPVTATVVRG
jgi:nucleotide-binding universal stress UspA family protein